MRQVWSSFLRTVCIYSCGFSGVCSFLSWCCHFHPARPRASRGFPPGRRLDPWLSLPGGSQDSFLGSLPFLRVQSAPRGVRRGSPRGCHWFLCFQGPRTQPRVSRSSPRTSTGSIGSSEVGFISSASWGSGSRSSFLGSLLFLRVQFAPRGMGVSSPREYHWFPWVQGGWRSLLLYVLHWRSQDSSLGD